MAKKYSKEDLLRQLDGEIEHKEKYLTRKVQEGTMKQHSCDSIIGRLTAIREFVDENYDQYA